LNPDPIRIRIRIPNTASWTWLLVFLIAVWIPIYLLILNFIKDSGLKAKPESGSTKNILILFFCYRESFDKENHEEEGRTGPRLYTTTFVPRIRSRSNKVPPTPVLWILLSQKV
jgi:hypothetical protein